MILVHVGSARTRFAIRRQGFPLPNGDTIMKCNRHMFLGALASIVGLAGGCTSPGWVPFNPHARMPSLVETGDEHRQRVSGVMMQNNLMLADDFDLLFMTDRPSRLTRWHSR